MKTERFRVSRELISHFEDNSEGFLSQTLTSDETWAHHNDPENKRQSMEYSCKGSPTPKKCKTKAPAGKVMLSVFWNNEGFCVL
jgi:hypothetical protein